jgi:hypothetical protein
MAIRPEGKGRFREHTCNIGNVKERHHFYAPPSQGIVPTVGGAVHKGHAQRRVCTTFVFQQFPSTTAHWGSVVCVREVFHAHSPPPSSVSSQLSDALKSMGIELKVRKGTAGTRLLCLLTCVWIAWAVPLLLCVVGVHVMVETTRSCVRFITQQDQMKAFQRLAGSKVGSAWRAAQRSGFGLSLIPTLLSSGPKLNCVSVDETAPPPHPPPTHPRSHTFLQKNTGNGQHCGPWYRT